MENKLLEEEEKAKVAQQEETTAETEPLQNIDSTVVEETELKSDDGDGEEKPSLTVRTKKRIVFR
jgi:hypothetical protein